MHFTNQIKSENKITVILYSFCSTDNFVGLTIAKNTRFHYFHNDAPTYIQTYVNVNMKSLQMSMRFFSGEDKTKKTRSYILHPIVDPRPWYTTSYANRLFAVSCASSIPLVAKAFLHSRTA